MTFQKRTKSTRYAVYVNQTEDGAARLTTVIEVLQPGTYRINFNPSKTQGGKAWGTATANPTVSAVARPLPDLPNFGQATIQIPTQTTSDNGQPIVENTTMSTPGLKNVAAAAGDGEKQYGKQVLGTFKKTTNSTTQSTLSQEKLNELYKKL